MDKSMFDGFFKVIIVIAVLSAVVGVILWEFVVWIWQHLSIAWK